MADSLLSETAAYPPDEIESFEDASERYRRGFAAGHLASLRAAIQLHARADKPLPAWASAAAVEVIGRVCEGKLWGTRKGPGGNPAAFAKQRADELTRWLVVRTYADGDRWLELSDGESGQKWQERVWPAVKERLAQLGDAKDVDVIKRSYMEVENALRDGAADAWFATTDWPMSVWCEHESEARQRYANRKKLG